jgi:cytochrome c biogenesis protein CcmG, thiol:disulfide interchange protein DsbE
MATVPRRVPKKPRDLTRWIAGLAGLCAAVATVLVLGPFRSEPRPPQPLAAFVLPNLRDASATLDSRRYLGRGLVVNFYFSTCTPCRAELPVLDRVARETPSVSFLGVDHGEPRADAERFLAEVPFTYDGALDETGSVAPALGVIAFPTTLFVDSRGVVVRRHQGAISEKELRRGIDLISHAS